MYNDISTLSNRCLIDWAIESIINNNHCTLIMSNFGHFFNIKLNHKWICWCFDVDNIGIISDGRNHLVFGISVFKKEATFFFLVIKPTERASVKVTRSYNLATYWENFKGQNNGAHP